MKCKEMNELLLHLVERFYILPCERAQFDDARLVLHKGRTYLLPCRGFVVRIDDGPTIVNARHAAPICLGQEI